jgi:hypothetical protein
LPTIQFAKSWTAALVAFEFRELVAVLFKKKPAKYNPTIGYDPFPICPIFVTGMELPAKDV